jgi:DNA-binding transcriptional regulator YiaG
MVKLIDKSKGLAIKGVRELIGLSQEEMAQRMLVSVATIHRWETGKAEPSRLAEFRLKRIRKEAEKLKGAK